MRGFRCHLYLVPPHLESVAPLAIPLLLYGLKKEGEFMLYIPVMSSARNDLLRAYVQGLQAIFDWIFFLVLVLSSCVSDP